MSIYPLAKRERNDPPEPATWPITRAVMPISGGTWVRILEPAPIPSVTFERIGDRLIITDAAGATVSLDAGSMRAIGSMMMQVAADIDREM